MSCLRVFALACSEQSIGKIVTSLQGRWFRLYTHPMFKLQDTNEWVQSNRSLSMVDFFIIDAWALLAPRLKGLNSVRQSDCAISFVDQEILPSVKQLNVLTFCPSFTQIFLFTKEGLLSGLLHDRLAGESLAAEELTPDTLSDFAESFSRVRLIDSQSQFRILSDEAAKQGVNLPENGLTGLAFKVVDNSEAVRAYQDRCKRFFFLVKLYNQYRGGPRKAFKKQKTELSQIYDPKSLAIECDICETGTPKTSRYDFQITELLTILFPEDKKEFVGFVKELVGMLGEIQKKVSDSGDRVRSVWGNDSKS
jgi:hypothetical protein